MEELRSYFPIFSKYPELAYLDNAATTQKPDSVLAVMEQFNRFENANIQRGVYDLSVKATKRFEEAREILAEFLGAPGANNIGFTKGATESINIVAQCFVKQRLEPGDNIVVTIMEHHANILPWQSLANEMGIDLRVAGILEDGSLDIDDLERLLDERTRIFSVTHISNTLGTINPIDKLISLAHNKNIPVMIDAAQSAALYDLNAQELQYDFLAFSGHKIFGPMGTGILYVKEDWREYMRPYNLGGGMIKEVELEETIYKEFPFNLEAGTPNVPGILGLAEAVQFLSQFDREPMIEHIGKLEEMCRHGLMNIDRVKIIGNAKERSGIVSFLVEDIHPHDLATFLNKSQIAVRAGMHCTQPLLDSMGIPATVRASFSIYNSENEVERLIESVQNTIKILG